MLKQAPWLRDASALDVPRGAQATTQSEEERLGVDFADLWLERQQADTLAAVDTAAAPREGSEPLNFKSDYAQGCVAILTQASKADSVTWQRLHKLDCRDHQCLAASDLAW